MKKATALLLALCMMFSLFACGNATDTPATDNPGQNTSTPESTGPDEPSQPVSSGEGKSVGFVLCGMGGEFFQSLAETYVTTMEKEGWTAYYADGQFDPATQIEQCENYITMGVDVLVIWSVTGEAMANVIKEARNEGIKVISFVIPTDEYDVLMVSDDVVLAGDCARLAAKWIDETYADEPDHSVPVAVLSFRTSENVSAQADELLKIAEYSTKAAEPKEFECTEETAAQGQSAAESLYITNPEIKVFLTAQGTYATGINAFYTGMSSPVTDYSGMGVFCINGDTAVAENIQKSKDDGSPIRGTVMTGGVQDTANELRDMIIGITDGTVEEGWVQQAGTLFVYADTVDEYLETGTVTTVTSETFGK